MFISELHVQGYKRLRDVKLPLGPLTVLIGPNACGKTSVLEVLDLLRASAQASLGEQLVHLGGISSIASRGVSPAVLGLAAAWPLAEAQYHLRIRQKGTGYEIDLEHLEAEAPFPEEENQPGVIIHGTPGHRACRRRGGSEALVDIETDDRLGPLPDVAFNEAETILSQSVDPPMPLLASLLTYALGKVTVYGPLDASPGSPVRQPQQLRPASLPGHTGENLAAALHTIRSRDRPMYDMLENALRAAYPGFEWLDSEPVAAGPVVLVWREHGRTFYANELSEGTLRFIWLTTILLSHEPPLFILIDEPEVSLHPDLLRILADLLVDASQRTQLLVATQSAELIGFLKPEHLAVMEIDDEGWANVTPASEMDLEKWLEDYTLGQLWTKGVLGGLP